MKDRQPIMNRIKSSASGLAPQTWVALVAGVLASTYAALVTSHASGSSIFAWASVVAVVLAILTAMQIQCMLRGPCPLGAWTLTCIAVIASVAYVLAAMQAARKAKADPKSAQTDAVVLSAGAFSVQIAPRQVTYPRPEASAA